MKSYIESLEALSKKQLVLMLARQRLDDTQGVAITGMACRFPGGIRDPRSLWKALCDRRVVYNEVREVPTDSTGAPRWNLSAPDIAPFADLLRQGSYLDDIDLFDAERFSLTDEEAKYIDPQQRLLLTVADEAVADAGASDLRQYRAGVFVGLSTVEYNYGNLRNGVRPDDLSAHMGLGGAISAAAARVALGLGAKGPVLTVDTACSSALTATHLAVTALRRRECDIAVVGASHLLLSPFTTAVLAKAGMLSPTGETRPFAADADGYVRGEGCAVLVLKREQDARADGDEPYALIRGTALYQNGERPAIWVTSGASWRRVIEQALRSADVDPLDVGYVEAQASGSKLASMIEVESLGEAYSRTDPGAPPMLIGSCKANLGYLETASAAASLMKTALVLNFGHIPAQPPFEPDPAIPWDRLALRVPQEPVAWPDAQARLAGVNSFGFTGTNAHVLLEATGEGPAREPETPDRGRGSHHWLDSNRWD